MSYHQVQVKGDEAMNMRFFYLCQTKGCGDVINWEYPVAEKNPSPKWCKNCQTKQGRDLITNEYNAIQKSGV